MKCERKRAYLTAEHAGRVAAFRQADGAPMLHPYECPECGCYHLSKMERVLALAINPQQAPTSPIPVEPQPVPEAKDPRLAEASAILRAQRGNFVSTAQNVSRWAVRLANGSAVVALTNGGSQKVKTIVEPDDEARSMYPSMFLKNAGD